MEPNYTSLSDINPMLDDVKVLARCISRWKSHPAGKPNEVWSLDMVLQDPHLFYLSPDQPISLILFCNNHRHTEYYRDKDFRRRNHSRSRDRSDCDKPRLRDMDRNCSRSHNRIHMAYNIAGPDMMMMRSMDGNSK